MTNILVSAIGGPNGHGVISCLKNIKTINLIGIDSSEFCPTSKLVDKFYVVPRIDNNDYLNKIKEIVDKENIDIIIPTLQPELKLVNEYRKLAIVISSTKKKIEFCLNKKNIYNALEENNLEQYIPKHKVLNDTQNIVKKARKIGYPEKPICYKPTSGHGGIGFKIIADKKTVAQKFFENKSSNWYTMDFLKNMLKYKKINKKVLLMEYLPGKEYSVDLFMDNGKVEIAIPRKRTKVSNGIVLKGKTEKNSDLINAVDEIMPIFKLNYFSNVQFRYDCFNNPKLIDLNPRFCGSQIMSFGSGINFPFLSIKKALGEDYNIPNPKWGVKMARYWESVFFDKE